MKKKQPEPVYLTLELTKTQVDDLLWALRTGDNAIWRLDRVEEAMGGAALTMADRKASAKRRDAIYSVVDAAHLDKFWEDKQAAEAAEEKS